MSQAGGQGSVSAPRGPRGYVSACKNLPAGRGLPQGAADDLCLPGTLWSSHFLQGLRIVHFFNHVKT